MKKYKPFIILMVFVFFISFSKISKADTWYMQDPLINYSSGSGTSQNCTYNMQTQEDVCTYISDVTYGHFYATFSTDKDTYYLYDKIYPIISTTEREIVEYYDEDCQVQGCGFTPIHTETVVGTSPAPNFVGGTTTLLATSDYVTPGYENYWDGKLKPNELLISNIMPSSFNIPNNVVTQSSSTLASSLGLPPSFKFGSYYVTASITFLFNELYGSNNLGSNLDTTARGYSPITIIVPSTNLKLR